MNSENGWTKETVVNPNLHAAPFMPTPKDSLVLEIALVKAELQPRGLVMVIAGRRVHAAPY